MPEIAASRVAEDYVTAIWKAAEWPDNEITTSALAAKLDVSKGTVSTTLRRLDADGLVSYEPYGDVTLTEAGRALAVAVVRRHRLIETYLVQRLGLGWDEVHDEADLLEHAVSDKVLERMDEVLGHPHVDPHGDPIPPHYPEELRAAVRIDHVEPGAHVRLVRVSDQDPQILTYLAGRGLTLGLDLHDLRVETALGIVRFTIDGERVEVSSAVATSLYVTLAADQA